ncbi:uncharacterized protein LOC126322586 [Schistocerca gregaria]|uniref:uncharacterized protein LOC126322586 n=1 Tax=Schistocerca gregaria TaxID=7010 RepID=UPI00211EB7BD|nr:uncharacterized protein LOC126322586 [Schistocerca gregaria]XP_049850407.1 uncharacterized protein LOC126322586 [Schistocerca gregaria]XP_049850408.1 uncharacterized protein LOC126322586 [Schistocerca gregaria]XP_049850409.1 uncharacterized protein LOC126322586 [Schistocerca gregaria]
MLTTFPRPRVALASVLTSPRVYVWRQQAKPYARNEARPNSEPRLMGLQIRSYARGKLHKAISRLKPGELEKMRKSAPPSMQQRETAYVLNSTNVILDPWLPPKLENPIQKKFWIGIWEWAKHAFMTRIAVPWHLRGLARLFGHPKVTRSAIRRAAKSLYLQFNQDLSKLELMKIRDYVSVPLFDQLKAKYSRVYLLPNAIPQWESKNIRTKIINVVVVQIPSPIKSHFLQASVRITGKQRLAVVDKNSGQLISGSRNFVHVEDIWVIERVLEKKDATWCVLSINLGAGEGMLDKAKSSRRENK